MTEHIPPKEISTTPEELERIDGQIEVERYAQISTWSKVLGFTWRAIRLRLKNTIGITGRDPLGRIQQNAFFAESDIRTACTDLFQNDFPVAAEDGSFEYNGERYGTIAFWSRILPISNRAITTRLKNKEGIQGRDESRQIRTFYPESLVRIQCADLLDPSLPIADAEGCIVLNELPWRTRGSWAKMFDISPDVINKRIENEKGARGRLKDGQIRLFFPESVVREACSNLLDEKLMQADENGIFEKDGERYSTYIGWERALDICGTVIADNLDKANGVPGRVKGGQIHLFFPESLVREKCANLLGGQNLPMANEEGFIEHSSLGNLGTITAISRLTGICSPTLFERTKNEKSIKARDHGNNIRDFFPVSRIYEICSDLLSSPFTGDENGFFVKDGVRYGSTGAWCKHFGLVRMTMIRRLNGCSGIQARTFSGPLAQFYPEFLVLEHCKDLLIECPSADQEGYIVLGSERYGTLHKWRELFGMHEKTIRARLNGAKGITGKTKIGKIQLNGFYPESLIREKCADVISEFVK